MGGRDDHYSGGGRRAPPATPARTRSTCPRGERAGRRRPVAARLHKYLPEGDLRGIRGSRAPRRTVRGTPNALFASGDYQRPSAPRPSPMHGKDGCMPHESHTPRWPQSEERMAAPAESRTPRCPHAAPEGAWRELGRRVLFEAARLARESAGRPTRGPQVGPVIAAESSTDGPESRSALTGRSADATAPVARHHGPAAEDGA